MSSTTKTCPLCHHRTMYFSAGLHRWISRNQRRIRYLRIYISYTFLPAWSFFVNTHNIMFAYIRSCYCSCCLCFVSTHTVITAKTISCIRFLKFRPQTQLHNSSINSFYHLLGRTVLIVHTIFVYTDRENGEDEIQNDLFYNDPRHFIDENYVTDNELLHAMEEFEHTNCEFAYFITI